MSMQFQNAQGEWVPYVGVSSAKYDELVESIHACLQHKPYVIVCITGNKGVGKTTLGKFMRKNGFGPFRPRDIAVIDDDCMSVDFLYFFRRKYVNPCRGIDELQPFFRLCPNKRVRFYVKSNPETRITFADVLLQVHLGESQRRKRLIHRYGEARGERVFQETREYMHRPRITFRYAMDADIQ